MTCHATAAHPPASAPFAVRPERRWHTIRRWLRSPLAEWRWYRVRRDYPSWGCGW